jgi:hypothetical protein
MAAAGGSLPLTHRIAKAVSCNLPFLFSVSGSMTARDRVHHHDPDPTTCSHALVDQSRTVENAFLTASHSIARSLERCGKPG